MKAYTDISQSKKLAEILPIESADMFYRDNGIDVKLMWEHNAQKVKTPCWSLSSLMAQMPCLELISSQDNNYRVFWKDRFSEWYENAVDACVELLLIFNSI
jgi:hypothetical protein